MRYYSSILFAIAFVLGLITLISPSFIYSYQAFVQATKHLEDYVWFQTDRHHEALELGQSRLQLAKERFHLLSLFKDLNLADSRAREAEFINWLADVRGHCMQKEAHELQALCPEAHNALSQYHA